MSNLKISSFFLFVLSTFLITAARGQSKTTDKKEIQQLIKIISKNIKYPSDFKEHKKAIAFSLKIVFSGNSKADHILSSEQAPDAMISNLIDIKNYANIDWDNVANHKLERGSTLIIPVTVTPDDNVDGLPNFTLNELKDLFKYSHENTRAVFCSFMLQPISLQYGEAKK